MRLGHRIIAVLLCVFSVPSALGCFKAENRAGLASETENAARTESDYRVDYGGRKDAFIGAEDSYPAGQDVTVYYDCRRIGTDTDYSFFLDGKRLDCDFEDGQGYAVRFVMPAHDAKLEYSKSNSLTARKAAGSVPGFQAPGAEALRIEFIQEEIRTDRSDGYALRVYDYDDVLACLEFSPTGGKASFYLVPKELIRDCRSIAEENGMGEWANRYERVPYGTPDGYTYRRFCCGGNGEEQIIADVARMPENGSQILDQLRDLLWTYATVTYALQPPAWSMGN